MRFALVLALVACGRDSTPPPTASSDALWALTPSGARGGIVISAKGLAMIERGYTDVRTLIETVPDLAAAKTQLTAALAPFGTAITLADFGLTSTKGAALFLMKDGMVAVLPLADRDKFLAKVHGTKGDVDRVDTTTCKLIREHYVCASSPMLLETIGNGMLKQHVTTRGEIEIVGAELPVGTPPMTVSAAIQLARGAAVLRATVSYLPTSIADKLSQTATPKIDPLRTAGFALLDLRAWLPGTEEKLLGDITLGKALASFDGLLSVVTPAGVTALNFEQPLNAVEPLATIVSNCREVPGADVLDASSNGGVCQIKPPDWDGEMHIWLDGKLLRIGRKTNPPVPAQVPLTPIGAELSREPWSVLFWGRGSMLAAPAKQVPEVDVPPESAMVIRMMAMVSELGFGARQRGDKVEIVATVRTIFSNPDEVVAKLAAITAKDIAATRGRALAEPIARSAPTSPFAGDFAAGYAGLLIPTGLAGQGVSMAVAALMFVRQQELAPPATP